MFENKSFERRELGRLQIDFFDNFRNLNVIFFGCSGKDTAARRIGRKAGFRKALLQCT